LRGKEGQSPENAGPQIRGKTGWGSHLKEGGGFKVGLQVTGIVLAAGPVHLNNVPGDGLVGGGVAVVEDDEEEVEAAHNGRGDGHVPLQRLAAVVAAKDGVGGREDGGAGV